MGGENHGKEDDIDHGPYRELIEQTSDLTLLLDDSNTIEFVNGSVSNILGFDRAAVIGTDLSTILARESNEDLEAAIAKIRGGEKGSMRVETRFRSADGRPRTVDVLVDGIGGPESAEIALTARQSAEATTESAVTEKERMRLALEGANLGIWDWDLRTDEIKRDELLTEMLGYSPEEFGDQLEDWKRLVHPNEKECHDQAFSEHIENRTPSYECEYRMRTADGDWKWLRTKGKVVKWDESGTPVRAVGIHQDIDDGKRAKLALQEERDLFRTGPSVVFKWRNEQGWPIEYVSPNVAEVFGYSPEALQSGDRRFSDLVHEADLDQLEREVTEQTADGQNRLHPDPYRVRTADGEIRWVMEYTRFVNAPEETELLLGYLVDITERRKHEERLEAQRDNLEVLNQVVRHDIRNELQLVVAYAEILAEYVQEEGDSYLTQIQEAARNAVTVTKTARDVMEVMLKTDGALKPVALRSTVEHQIEEIRSSNERAVVRIDGSIPTVSVLADDMLEAVFRNLLKNAIQHNDKPVPEVIASATEREDRIQVRIADNGPGIPESRKSALFEKGERGIDSDGTGLGLHLVDTLLERYGGDISIEDNEPEGAVFVVELPVAAD